MTGRLPTEHARLSRKTRTEERNLVERLIDKTESPSMTEESIAAAEAGAAILHLHARHPKDGRPTPDSKMFMQFLPRIKAACDAVINITTGGSMIMTLEQRLAAPLEASPEMCSLNSPAIRRSVRYHGRYCGICCHPNCAETAISSNSDGWSPPATAHRTSNML
jgi:hypothetical protein